MLSIQASNDLLKNLGALLQLEKLYATIRVVSLKLLSLLVSLKIVVLVEALLPDFVKDHLKFE